MKKLLFVFLTLSILMPVKAQYLLDDEYNYNKQSKDEIVESYKFSGNDSDNKGFRGFIDAGLGISTTEDAWGGNFNMIMLNATGGYQIIDRLLFVGGGIGFWHMYDYSANALPIFADVRSEFCNFGKISIFADLKIGYSVTDQTGLFLDPNFGIRYGLNDKLGLNFGLGYQVFNDTEFTYEGGSGLGYFNIKLGIDF